MTRHHLTTTIVLALLLALAGLPAFAAKVDVCHLPPGNPDNWHTISVSSNALGAHLGHGDLEGSCAENCETLCDDFDACTQDIESDYEQCICNAEPRPAVKEGRSFRKVSQTIEKSTSSYLWLRMFL